MYHFVMVPTDGEPMELGVNAPSEEAAARDSMREAGVASLPVWSAPARPADGELPESPVRTSLVFFADSPALSVAEAGARGGRVGGKSRSAAKVAAVRANGAKGGRPPVLCNCGDIYGQQCAERTASHPVALAWVPTERRGSAIVAGRSPQASGCEVRLTVAPPCAERILRDEGEWAWRVARPAAAPRVVVRYACCGPVRGQCQHEHRTLSGAASCLRRDRAGCASQGGYSDRSVWRLVGGELVRLTTAEEEQVEGLLAVLDGERVI